MTAKPYRSIVVHGKEIVSITAFLENKKLGFLKPEKIDIPNGVFSTELQVEHFQKEGYDVHVDAKNGVTRIISAIPKESTVNHAEWMQTCAEFLNEQ